MAAASLFLVFALAKLLVLADRDVQLTPWTLAAYVWQDAAVALAFALLGLIRARAWRRFVWAIYGLACAYAAINVPVARILSTPLSAAMLRGARGTLGDSIRHYLTAANVGLMISVAAAAVAVPLILARLGRRAMFCVLGLAAVCVPIGPIASARLDSKGLHRNVFVVLVETSIPSVAPRDAADDFRASPFPSPPAEDLTRYRGAARGRDVIVMMLESTGAGYLRPYGAAEDPMPRLTALARRAILFESAYCVYPESIKGLFSVLTSRYPAIDTAPEAHGKLDVPSIATALRAAGYRTGLFHSGRFVYLGMDSIVAGRGFDVLEDAGDIGGVRESSFGVDEPTAVHRVLGFIDSVPREQRYLAVYLPIAGHHPYEAPRGGPFPEREEIGRYRNALRYSDEALAAIVDGLEARGRLGSTLIVLAGDHGEAFGQHEGNNGHTFFVYEENVRVPMLVVAPGVIEQEVRVKRLASLVDLTPTVLDLLGLEAPRGVQGRSLLEPSSGMALFFTDYSLRLLGLRDGQWKLIHDVGAGRSSLFDLSRDPGEKDDLSAREPERAAAYAKRLMEWSAAQRAKVGP